MRSLSLSFANTLEETCDTTIMIAVTQSRTIAEITATSLTPILIRLKKLIHSSRLKFYVARFESGILLQKEKKKLNVPYYLKKLPIEYYLRITYHL